MPSIYEHLHTVGQEEMDLLGHASNLAYVGWMQDAAVAHSAAQGWPTERYLQIGAGWVVRSHAIQYRQPAFAGQTIVVRTWVANFRKIRSLRKYKIVRHPLTIFFGYFTVFLIGMTLSPFGRDKKKHWGGPVAIVSHYALFALIGVLLGWLNALLIVIVPLVVSLGLKYSCLRDSAGK